MTREFVAGERPGQTNSDHWGPFIFDPTLGKVALFLGDSLDLNLPF